MIYYLMYRKYFQKKGLSCKDKHLGMTDEGGCKFKKEHTDEAEERIDEVLKQMRSYRI